MPHIVHTRIRRRPMASIFHKETRVKIKLVAATTVPTPMELLKPIALNSVLEKYIRALKPLNCCIAMSPQATISARRFDGMPCSCLRATEVLMVELRVLAL